MAAPNPAAKRAQSRQAKQKKLLIVLVPVLIAVMVFTVPRTLKQLRGDGEAGSAPSASTTQAAAGGTNGGAAGSPTAPAVDPAAVAASAKAILEDTDSHPEASEGQLISFSRFDSRDPFVQLVEDEAPDTSATDSSGAVPVAPPTVPTTTSPTTPTTTVPTDSSTDTNTTPITKVKISVNGTAHVLGVGDAFPGDDPAFKVVTIGDDFIEVGLVSGTFSTGVNTITLRLGDPVTLISQPDGARYTIKLLGPA